MVLTIVLCTIEETGGMKPGTAVLPVHAWAAVYAWYAFAAILGDIVVAGF